jgi:hypothetical protein
MAVKFGLTGIVAGIVGAVCARGIDAEAMQCAYPTRTNVNTQVTSPHSFCYDLRSERGYNVSYFVTINNNKSCRIADLSKIYPGDLQLQLVESGTSSRSGYWRVIPLTQFLPRNTPYSVTVVDSSGRERPLDSVKPGDKSLKFYPVDKKAPFKANAQRKQLQKSDNKNKF